MNPSNTYQSVRIGDVADWRLIICVSATGACAYLRHDNPTEPLVTIFEQSWKVSESEILSKIESAIYDHPQVLDDFTADVIVVAPDTLWVPSDSIADDEEQGEDWYSMVFGGKEEDVMVAEAGKEASLFALVPGLKAFLQRTFPGARIHSHLEVLVSRLRSRSPEEARIFVDIRKGECDLVAFDRKELLSASTHSWREIADIRYHIHNLINVYGLNPESIQVSLSGLREVKTELLPLLREKIGYVMLTMTPTVAQQMGLSLPVALMLRQ
ncbi:MAG: DUF3822 family protein [Muribaculaceae bacterium]|nr:DUF3822 family protein [Muribaculaceae bacterium]